MENPVLALIKALKQSTKPTDISKTTSYYCTEYNCVFDSHLDSSNSKINKREAIISVSCYDPIACYLFLPQLPFHAFSFSHIVAHSLYKLARLRNETVNTVMNINHQENGIPCNIGNRSSPVELHIWQALTAKWEKENSHNEMKEYNRIRGRESESQTEIYLKMKTSTEWDNTEITDRQSGIAHKYNFLSDPCCCHVMTTLTPSGFTGNVIGPE